MNQIHLHGWLYKDSNKMLCVRQKQKPNALCDKNIIEKIEKSVETEYRHSMELCGYQIHNKNAIMRVYVTDKECDIDDAMTYIVARLYGEVFVVAKLYGQVFADIRNAECSEWGITGFDVEEFRIGGHDLNAELDRYIGQYIHFVLEYED